MCDTCGCGDPEILPVHVHESLLKNNDNQALHNREHFQESGVLALNIMGSPGCGKTALLEATANRLGGQRLRAMSGDLATDNDGTRLRAAGIPSLTITTGTACHLDARLVHNALHDLEWRAAEYLFIENVGNLVCPAIYDLGQAANVVVLSVTEGEDKPLKYPVMFQRADLVLFTKIDLLPHLPGVKLENYMAALARVNPKPKCIPISAVTGEGLEQWTTWLAERRTSLGPTVAQPAGHTHPHTHAH
jgi:hydrogenase nickel incorporation protein HypB